MRIIIQYYSFHIHINMKKTVFCFLTGMFLSAMLAAQGSKSLNQLMNDFVSTDWSLVLAAKENLENTGKECIPEIILLMNDCKMHKLLNTGDLIYPGAEKYFGHGQIIDYDIDDICVRAGWLLEELTFMNFGFTGIHLPENELTDFIRLTFPEYYSAPANQRQLEELTATGKRKLIRSLSIENAKSWWKNQSENWSRLIALEDALNSNDDKRQVKALFYIRNGKTVCSGLNEKYYTGKLEKSVAKLSRDSISRVSENAKLILLDTKFEWLLMKAVQ